jgi:hypothetical protein
LIAYVAEEPSPTKPVFNNMGYKKGGCAEKDFGSWKGQGDWEDGWGETYSAKRRPTLFVIDIIRFFIIHINVGYYLDISKIVNPLLPNSGNSCAIML